MWLIMPGSLAEACNVGAVPAHKGLSLEYRACLMFALSQMLPRNPLIRWTWTVGVPVNQGHILWGVVGAAQ